MSIVHLQLVDTLPNVLFWPAGFLLCVPSLVEMETGHRLDTSEWRRLGQKCTQYMSNFVNEVCLIRNCAVVCKWCKHGIQVSVLPSNWLKVPLVVNGWRSLLEIIVTVLLEVRSTECHWKVWWFNLVLEGTVCRAL